MLPPSTWTPFGLVSSRHDASSIIMKPTWYEVLPRLAHGWLDKTKWRYCWQCHLVLPRDPAWFLEKGRLGMNSKLPWRQDKIVGVNEAQWKRWGKRQRYAWLIDDWCHAKREDMSGTYCHLCKGYWFRTFVDEDCYEVKTMVIERREAMTVECPICLEKDLKFEWWNPNSGWHGLRKRSLVVLDNANEIWSGVFWEVYWGLWEVGRSVAEHTLRCVGSRRVNLIPTALFGDG